MNPALKALVTKLNWQLDELNLHLKMAQEESLHLSKQLEHLDQSLHHPKESTRFINPELEMSCLNFLMQQQEKKEKVRLLLKNQQTLEATLNEKLQRIKTELKMLEKYMDREVVALKEHHLKIQQHALDEWAIQKRDAL